MAGLQTRHYCASAIFTAALLIAGIACADPVPVLKTSLPRGAIITEDMVHSVEIDRPAADAVRDAASLIGKQTQRALPADKPLRAGDTGAPVLVKRNDNVTLVYNDGQMILSTRGRALGQGGLGDNVSVMNQASRKIIIGTVQADGSVNVTSRPEGKGL